MMDFKLMEMVTVEIPPSNRVMKKASRLIIME